MRWAMELKYPDEADMRKEIAKLSKRLERVQQKYQQAKNPDRKKTLAFLIEDIKNSIGWELLNCKDYEKALAVYQSMSWEIYGEYKYRGISLALIKMEYYDEARQLLEKGLQRFPKSHFLLMRMGIV
jgi:tetratricopeptide (TPR) repeat protein